MKLYLLLAFMLIEGIGLSQKLKPFGDNLRGIKSKTTGKVLIPPKYEKIVDYNDSMIIVRTEYGRYGVVDTLDQIIVPFSEAELFFDKYTEIRRGQLMEKATEINNALAAGHYYIDKKRNCIPYDDCPCPSTKQLADSVPLYLQFIHKGIVCFDKKMSDSANYFFDKAITANPTNLYPYTVRVQYSLYDTKSSLNSKDSLGIDELKKINTLLDKAYLLKVTPKDYIRILNFKHTIVKNYEHDKKKTDSIETELKKYNPMSVYTGWMLNAGVSYSNGYEFEIGLGYSLFCKNEKFGFNPLNATGITAIGCSYLKNITQKVDGYKFYFFSLIKPINFSLSPILFTDYKNTDWVLRPEFGFGYWHFSVNVGYNLFTNKELSNTLNTYNVNFKFYLPIVYSKHYTSR